MKIPLGVKAVYVALILSVSSALVKVAGGLVSGSLALLADGADSLLNVVSVLSAAVLYIRSLKPPDREHPYGHYGYEVLSAIITSMAMICVVTALVTSAIAGLKELHEIGGIGLVCSGISTVMVALCSHST